MGMYTVPSNIVRIKDARTLFPPWGEVKRSRIVCRGKRSRSPGSDSSNPISTPCMGSMAGTGGGARTGAGGVGAGAGAGAGAGTDVAIGLATGGLVRSGKLGARVGVLSTGGILVTGVDIGARVTLGEGIGVKLPEGGGILVTGVDISRGGTEPGKIVFGTGGIGAA